MPPPPATELTADETKLLVHIAHGGRTRSSTYRLPRRPIDAEDAPPCFIGVITVPDGGDLPVWTCMHSDRSMPDGMGLIHHTRSDARVCSDAMLRYLRKLSTQAP